MSDRTFIDTNVLVYADDQDAGERTVIAKQILTDAIRTRTAVVSTQVLQEFFVVATRKLGMSAEIARRKVELLAQLEVVRIDTRLILEAIDLHRLNQVSFWDALVVCSARAGSCARVLTEDLQDGAVLGGVRIENPFRARL